MMANIVAMFHSALHMDDGYVKHIAIVQDVDGYHNHFLYDEDKGKGAAGTGPFKTIEDAKQDVIAHYPDAKEKEISPAGYRYYSTQRPIMPGGYPKPKNNEVLEIENFDNKKFVEEVGCQAWGYIEYKKPLGHFDVIDYELAAVKIKTLHLKYIGRDDWGRYVYEDENGKLWKNTDCCSPRECCEERGDTLNSSAGNEFDGEPDCFMAAHIKVEYLPEEGGEQDG